MNLNLCGQPAKHFCYVINLLFHRYKRYKNYRTYANIFATNFNESQQIIKIFRSLSILIHPLNS